MLSPRSWACTYTSDTHKKPKNARWVDGILEVSFFGATERFAKLYAADDDNKPVGAPVARRKLVDAEFDAVTEGDPVRGLEGFDVHPDEEIHETNQEPSIKSEANEDALEKKTRRVPFAPRGRAVPGASAAALRPFRAPGAVARATVSAKRSDGRRATAARRFARETPRVDLGVGLRERLGRLGRRARRAGALRRRRIRRVRRPVRGPFRGRLRGEGPESGNRGSGNRARSVRRASEQVRRVRHERSDSNEPEPIFAGGRDGNGRREPSRERRPRDG